MGQLEFLRAGLFVVVGSMLTAAKLVRLALQSTIQIQLTRSLAVRGPVELVFVLCFARIVSAWGPNFPLIFYALLLP
jgi:hypothetical protein